MKRIICCFLLFLFLFSQLSVYAKPHKTQLQIRDMQTRSFDTNDIKLVMKAVANTLQDDDFILKETNTDLGIISAEKEFQKKEFHTMRMIGDTVGFGGGIALAVLSFGILTPIPVFYAVDMRKMITKQNCVIEATANITGLNNQTKVRVNFREKAVGETKTKIKPIEDELFYQAFFSKVDKSIFIQKENI